MNSRYLALIAAFLATSIYGINHTIAKEVMPIYIGSSGFIMLRLQMRWSTTLSERFVNEL